LLQIGLHQRGEGRIALGRGDPGAFVRVIVDRDCDIAHKLTVSQFMLGALDIKSAIHHH